MVKCVDIVRTVFNNQSRHIANCLIRNLSVRLQILSVSKMSVLNQSGEEQVECPLCMEPLEVDDLNFFPCTCGYQICRFCWHRIRTDENGLCPACRKAYSEDPADFIPLSQEQVAKLKAEKRQRDQQRKAKLSESRKHLASVRVVQRNLVFVVGLPMRLADAEVLKKHEYFGKFGKIHKVVINQSTSYAGSQGPSASAYVTYVKSDDALRAIQSVNNITIDGRLIKSSLGTTKYCSHFMKNQTCPKSDCMYLHDFGDPEASFTKEQMHAGKHQEYEKKLHEALLQRTTHNTNNNTSSTTTITTTTTTTTENKSPPTVNKLPKETPQLSTTATTTSSSTISSNSGTTVSNNNGTNKDYWPQLNLEKDKKEKDKAKKVKTKNSVEKKKDTTTTSTTVYNGKINDKTEKLYKIETNEDTGTSTSSSPPTSLESDSLLAEILPPPQPPLTTTTTTPSSKLHSVINDNSSFFSSNTFQKITLDHQGGDQIEQSDGHTEQTPSILTDTLPVINTTEDWAAAFGFTGQTEQIDNITNQREIVKGPLETFGFSLNHDNGFSKGTNNWFNAYDKLHENLADVLHNKTNGFNFKQDLQNTTTHLPNGLNGLDQSMSKFFIDFQKNNKEIPPAYTNGYNGVHLNNYFPNASVQNHAERMLLLQQKQLNEQLRNLSIGKDYITNNTPSIYQNGTSNTTSAQQQQQQQQHHYVNGDIQHNGSYDNLHGQLFGNSSIKQNTRNSEDELDFDPFQETQKAFAELMANEQDIKTRTAGRNNQVNGVIHNQNSGHLPPPPPGFVQPNNTHMNSFGSKILPFLNMSNSQQITNTTQNNWPSSYNTQLQQQQHKNLSNTCNDWKVLDPAILTSSRHYPLANIPIRESFSNIQQINTQQQQQQQQQQLQNNRPYDFTTNNTFSNFTQLQPNFNNFTHLNTQSNINWFSSDLNSQLSSPPGFRNSQTSKQQEC